MNWIRIHENHEISSKFLNFRKKYYYRNLSYFTDYTSDYLKKHEGRVTGLYIRHAHAKSIVISST